MFGQLAIGTTGERYKPCKMLDSTGAEMTGINHIMGSGYLTFATKNENGLYVVGYANKAQNFTESKSTKTRFIKTLEDKKIIGMAVTKSLECQTGLVIDSQGNIWTCRI